MGPQPSHLPHGRGGHIIAVAVAVVAVVAAVVVAVVVAAVVVVIVVVAVAVVGVVAVLLPGECSRSVEPCGPFCQKCPTAPFSFFQVPKMGKDGLLEA